MNFNSAKYADSKLRFSFFLLWLCSMFIQAFLTELTADEAYYWMYSKNLAWGYFDHPPMIAVAVKFGFSIFKNELGVRLFPILMGTASIFIWEKIIQPKNLLLFYLLITSIFILHFTHLFAIPDSPLLFFTSALLLEIKRNGFFTSLKSSLYLGLLMALMILSKYHAFLILLLLGISNLSILKKKNFWYSVVTTLLLITPHIIWQLENQLPSIKYHLFERSVESYQFWNTLHFLGSQLIFLGPITGIFFFISIIKINSKNHLEKSLKSLFIGAYIFFFFMTFKGRVEAHWTLFTVIPGLYFGSKYFESQFLNGAVKKIVIATSIFIVFVGKFALIYDTGKYFQLMSQVTESFHGKKEWADAIKSKLGMQPIAFLNSYKNAAIYQFYTGNESFSLNNIMGRKNQYDIWNYENKYRGKDLSIISTYPLPGFKSISNKFEETKFRSINNFQANSNIKIQPLDAPNIAKPNDTLSFKIDFTFPDESTINSNPLLTSSIFYYYLDGKNLIKMGPIMKLKNQDLRERLKINVPTPNQPGRYNLFLSVKNGWLPGTINSKSIGIAIKS